MSTRPRPAAERTRDRTYSAPYPPRQSRVPGPPRRSNSSLESSSRGAPSRTTEPYPTIWMSTELKIDPFAMPSLPRLPLGLVEQVYTHKSWLGSYHNNYTKDEARSYKPLEFFGDSAIEFQVSRVLCERFPLAGPGLLTFLRSRIVNNRTLAVLGWYCGLPDHLLAEKRGDLRNKINRGEFPQYIAAEIFEAYMGALARDRSPSSREAFESWFDQLLGPDSRVFSDLEQQAEDKAEELRHKDYRTPGILIGIDADGNAVKTPQNRVQFHCDVCFGRSAGEDTDLFKFEDRDCSGCSREGPGYWHTTLVGPDGEKIACGRSHKRLDARQKAWASGLAKAKNLQ